MQRQQVLFGTSSCEYTNYVVHMVCPCALPGRLCYLALHECGENATLGIEQLADAVAGEFYPLPEMVAI